MMSDAVLQILLILAYLAIGLIAIVFPIYAICVTFLPQERWESEKERKKRIESLKGHISKLAKELSGETKDSERFKEIQTRIEQHASEKERLEYLTAKGAVGKPVILSALALLAAIIGILVLHLEHMELALVSICGAFSGMFSAGAVYRLYKTISSVEHAALRPARTIDFAVDFGEGGKTTHEIKRGQKTELKVAAGTIEESLEYVEIDVYVPPMIEVKDLLTNETSVLQPKGAEFPGYTCVMRTIPYVHAASHETVLFTVLPKKTGIYKIPVRVCAKGIYEYHAWLTLNVVK